ncbi:hypothetical protein HD806DRAFT_505320 [Xylariaceae sp. AK1471]|nr:hypothetical protein HD806DRAFT_505320 [Xylariaceae sp. AK1471]
MPDSKPIIGPNYEGEDLRLWLACNKLYQTTTVKLTINMAVYSLAVEERAGPAFSVSYDCTWEMTGLLGCGVIRLDGIVLMKL